MTERLYYRDSFQREFDARVLSCEQEGDRWRVVLDRTAFYPTSGGQPHDLGQLGGARVTEVLDSEEHGVVHYVSAALPRGPVHGAIDWQRRFDHMQQHTGQHLLSAVFLGLFKLATVSFHLGREVSTIDLDAPAIDPRRVGEAEQRTNEIIFEDRLVSVTFGTAAELAAAGVRKAVDREGVLRAIEIEAIDRQPCGGTHLARTGQAGLLLVRGIERRRNLSRIEFVCGFRALSATRTDFGMLAKAAELLACGLPEIPAALGRAVEERRSQHSAHKRLENRLAELEAQSLLATAQKSAGTSQRIVCHLLPDPDVTPDYLRLLGARLAGETQVVALLANKAGHVVFAQTKGGPGDLGRTLRELLQQFGGKGGGARDFAQGSVHDFAKAAEALARAKELLLQA